MCSFIFMINGECLSTVIDEYRRRDMLLGREITYERDGVLFTGKAAGIEDDGSLAVISDGQRQSLGSGMVSLKI